ncbi:hypothetical protein PTI98_008709 [Pleurotus ostreatus]|uniref:Uncharacterized protein n=1 Tax=Pleurotus cornucopiae TaxID=5321 RepID=A0ACB7IU37_PLECO|nr:hypothetical protein CCMSSC00406_0006730 [Pleurotus cornucopiae]KAJ8693739.1 hypothetical protein PTI98_008709 [Pleurotus ostreatus]
MAPRLKREEDPSNDKFGNRFGWSKSNSGKFGEVDKKGKTRLSSEGDSQSDDTKSSNSGSNSDSSKSSGSSNGSDSNRSSSSNSFPNNSFGGGNSGGSSVESNGSGIDNSPIISTPAADTPSSSSDTTSTSSPAPTSSKFGNPSQAKTPQCFSCIADNDARVLYSGPWTLNSANFSTSHSTTTPGSSLSLVFNGTGIVVFGTVPPSNSTHPPPSASYTIDADPPFTTNEPLATETIRFQPLFKVSSLSASEHRIFINVTGAETPYTIDSFFIVPGPSAAGLADAKDGAGPTVSSDPTPSTPNAPSIPSSSDLPPANSHNTAQVIGGVLGGLFFLVLLIVFGFFLERRRRRRRQGNPSGMAWFDKYTRQHTVPAPTIFTSTESIMQATPSSLWSTFSRSDRQSLATFSPKIVPKVRDPPPLPPKPRTRLSLPIIGVDHQIP